MMKNNVFYFNRLNVIGGIETFFWHIARKYKDYDITIYFREADLEQVKRLKEYVRVVKWTGERIRCKRAFFCYNMDIIDHVDADEYFMVAHGDYKSMGIKPHIDSKIERLIAISEQSRSTFSELTGRDVELCYNPIFPPKKPKRVLKLISASRFTYEKGKARIEKLADILNESGIPFIWTIFTNDKNIIRKPNLSYVLPTLNIENYIADADYLVQLSDSEGYCYSVVEALLLGTPVIVTPCPVFHELGIKDGIHGHYVDWSLEDFDPEKIYKKLPKFKYDPPADRWDELLASGESTYIKDRNTIIEIEILKDFFDIEKGELMKRSTKIKTNKVRAEELIQKGFAKCL